MSDTKSLLETIQSLPPERIAEVADFVAFLANREQERALTAPWHRPVLPFLVKSETTRKTTPTTTFEFGDVVPDRNLPDGLAPRAASQY